MNHVSSGRSFTLIEMVVVVAAVMLVAGLLLPVLGSARGTARMAVCKSNLKQLGTATFNFAAERSFHLPQPFQDMHFTASGSLSANQVSGRALWFNALDPYLGQLRLDYSRGDASNRNYDVYKQDPAWLDVPEPTSPPQPLHRDQVRTLKMNHFLGEAGRGVRAVRISEVPRPGSVVLFFDGRAHDTPSVTTGNVDADDFSGTAAFVAPRHADAANLAGLDGAVGEDRRPILHTAAGYPMWDDDGPMRWDWQRP